MPCFRAIFSVTNMFTSLQEEVITVRTPAGPSGRKTFKQQEALVIVGKPAGRTWIKETVPHGVFF